MQPLVRTLQDHDLGHLRILAELWGLDPSAGPPPQAARALAAQMLDPATLGEMVASLPAEARQVLEALAASHGRLPLADLTRRFGPLRELGAGRRDREKPWRSPVSPLEVLWYRGLLARAFADTPTGACEFGFVPADVLAQLTPTTPASSEILGAPASPPATWHAALLTSVDDATTLLAALRRRPARDDTPSSAWLSAAQVHLHQPASATLLLALLRQQGVVQSAPLRPIAAAAKSFLELPRCRALHGLVRTWAGCTTWNDLAHIPGVDSGAEGWPNDPQVSRQIVLTWLEALPRGAWWDVEAFVAAVRERHPGFQRPGGDFDSWYLRDTASGAFLRGFEHWDAIEGAYLRHLIGGPLHALGAADIFTDLNSGAPRAFRLTQGFNAVSSDASPSAPDEAANTCTLQQPDGHLSVPRLADRAQRYLIARFCSWLGLAPDTYAYRMTPRSLEAAARQGLKATHVLAVLEATTASTVPPALRRAIERAFLRGPEAAIQRSLVLRVENPRLLDELRRHRSTARFLGDPLGPHAVAIRGRGDWEALCAAAARLGLLIEPPTYKV
jgi:hypothetical protein